MPDYTLIAVLIAGTLFVQWLHGSTFARVLVSLILGFVGFSIFPPNSPTGIFAIVFAILGWYVSGIPTFAREFGKDD